MFLRKEKITHVDHLGKRHTHIECVFICDECKTQFQKRAKPKDLAPGRLNFCSKGCYRGSEAVQRKTHETNLKRYGVENSAACPAVKEKLRKTCLERYGVENSAACPAVKEKLRKTCLERYGETSALKNAEVREKYKKTCIEKYGVDNPLKNKEILENRRQTNIERYGGPAPVCNEQVKEKMKQTNLERYGNTCVMQVPEIRKKIIEGWIKKYGTKNPIASPVVKAKIDFHEVNRKGIETRLKSGTMYISKPEQQLYDALVNHYGNDDVKRQSWINRRSIDFYVKSQDTYVQLDGVYWHGLLPSCRAKYSWQQEAFDNDRSLDHWIIEHAFKMLRVTDLFLKIDGALERVFESISLVKKGEVSYLGEFHMSDASSAADASQPVNG
jgi:very-short-patch-repair endonuclease